MHIFNIRIVVDGFKGETVAFGIQIVDVQPIVIGGSGGGGGREGAKMAFGATPEKVAA